MAFRFAYVCDLYEKLEAIELQSLENGDRLARRRNATREWFDHHRSSIDPHKINLTVLLSCLLPEKRPDRKFHTGFRRLSTALVCAQCLPREYIGRLEQACNSADFANEAFRILNERCGSAISNLSIDDVDGTLAQLASIGRASSSDVKQNIDWDLALNQNGILSGTLQRLTPRELRWFIRLLLKNLGPAEMNENLVYVNTHPWLPSIMRVRQDFTKALDALKDPQLSMHEFQWDAVTPPDGLLHSVLKPLVGTKIGRPEHFKMRSIKHCMQWLGQECWNAEVKYDGEYVQVHCDLQHKEQPLQLFSKSGRDSTKDRIALLRCLRRALGIDSNPRFSQNCILEGEMVLFDCETNKILPFHSIRKHVSRAGHFIGTTEDSEVKQNERLGVVFYDLLMVDDDSVMHEPYEERRKRLKKLVSFCDHQIMTSQYTRLDLRPSSGKSRESVELKLEKAFSKALSLRCEGLVLKPISSSYLNLGIPKYGSTTGRALKLKADYIDGLGDTADMAIVGAYKGEMKGIPARFYHLINLTHFIIACIVNKDQAQRHGARPLYKTMSVISRDAISVEDVLELNRASRIIPFPVEGPNTVNFDVQIGVPTAKPSYLYALPVVAELVSAGFERARDTRFMTLRFPRIVKLHLDDRSIGDVVSFDEIQEIAAEAARMPQDQKQEIKRWSARIRSLKAQHGQIMDHSAERDDSVSTPSLVQGLLVHNTVSDRHSPETRSPEILDGHLAQWIELYKNAATPRGYISSATSPTSAERTKRPPVVRVDSEQLDEIGSRYVSAVPVNGLKRTRTESPLISPPKKRHAVGRAADAGSGPICIPPLCQKKTNSKPGPLTDRDPNTGSGKHLEHTTNVILTADTKAQPAQSLYYTAPLPPTRQIDLIMPNSQPNSNEGSVTADPVDHQYPCSHIHDDVEYIDDESRELGEDDEDDGGSVPHNVWDPLPTALKHRSPFSADGTAIHIPDFFRNPLLKEYIMPLLISDGEENSSVDGWDQSLLKSNAIGPTHGPKIGAPKIVFVDRRCRVETISALDAILKIDLHPSERIQIWDIRLLERLVELDTTDQSRMSLAEEISPYMFGIIRSMKASPDWPVMGNTLDTGADDVDELDEAMFLFSEQSRHDLQRPLMWFRHKPEGQQGASHEVLTNVVLRGGDLPPKYADILAARWFREST